MTKIIEFYGLPGVGKSTICDLLEEKLNLTGYKVINIQKQKKCITIQDKINKAILTLKSFAFIDNIKLYKILNNYKRVYGKNELSDYWIRRIIVTNYLLKKEIKRSTYDYILLDEGIVQFITSIVHDEVIKNDIYTDEICKNISNVYSNYTTVIHCNLDYKNIIGRLKKRNKKNDRFIFTDEDMMLKVLKKKEKNLDTISHKILFNEYIDLNLEDKLDLNCQKIMNRIAYDRRNK